MKSLVQLLAAVASLTNLALAHSHVDYIIVNGHQYPGFDPKIPNNTANVVGWFTTASDDGFVPPSNYTTPDIICHRNGAPAVAHAPVRPGDKVYIQWNGWPISHAGPALSYLASCGDRADGCATVDKASLRFFKIDNSAPAFLNESGGPPGFWASNVLISANNSWTVEVPPTLAPGAYVLRHELIALHLAAELNGAQNYPQCINLLVTTDTGTATASSTLVLTPASGTPATALYKPTDPGISINIFTSLSTYVVPGPSVISGAAPVPQSLQKPQVPTAGGTPVLVTGTTGATPAPSETITDTVFFHTASGGLSARSPQETSNAPVSESIGSASASFSVPAASSDTLSVASTAATTGYTTAPAASSEASQSIGSASASFSVPAASSDTLSVDSTAAATGSSTAPAPADSSGASYSIGTASATLWLATVATVTLSVTPAASSDAIESIGTASDSFSVPTVASETPILTLPPVTELSTEATVSSEPSESIGTASASFSVPTASSETLSVASASSETLSIASASSETLSIASAPSETLSVAPAASSEFSESVGTASATLEVRRHWKRVPKRG